MEVKITLNVDPCSHSHMEGMFLNISGTDFVCEKSLRGQNTVCGIGQHKLNSNYLDRGISVACKVCDVDLFSFVHVHFFNGLLFNQKGMECLNGCCTCIC